jgi:hypothetical protein
VHDESARRILAMAKTYEGDELASRTFMIVMVGVGAVIAAMALIGL